MTPLDRQRLDDALALAERAIGLSDPNPRVGCIIGTIDGRILGQGHTQRVGEPHAEVMALREAATLGHDLRGATAWVTLEPCAHHGRTPPCCDALVGAGLARVVVAVGDPFEQVAGQGIQRLRAAGIEVVMAEPEMANRARQLNIGFFSRIERGRPWVRVKAAASMDGATALMNGCSQWITGAPAREDGHAWRRRANAVLTGVGTVMADDPRLDVRLVATAVQPVRYVVDSQLRSPLTSKIFQPPGQAVLVSANPDSRRLEATRRSGIDVIVTPSAGGRVDLVSLLRTLAERDVNELHVEAGATLNGALLSAGVVDELVLYLAPRLLGPGKPIVGIPALSSLSESIDGQLTDVTLVGSDLRATLRLFGPRAGSSTSMKHVENVDSDVVECRHHPRNNL